MDLLWKKDGSEYVSLMTLHMKALESSEGVHAMTGSFRKFIGVQRVHKSNKISTEIRELGNKHYDDKQWSSAIECYSKSISFAEIDTENLGLAYSNRSACFFQLKMYEECFVDIQTALNESCKCPQRVIAKLKSREAECMKLWSASIKIDAPQLDFQADEKFPGMANVLQMVSDGKFGRHFIAKCDIGVGKIILVEKTFVNSPILEKNANRCETCFKKWTNLIPCVNCASALFCGDKCYDENKFHKIICGKYDPTDDQHVQFVVRSVLLAMDIFPNTKCLIEFVENVINEKNDMEIPNSITDMKSKYRMFLKLNLWMTDEDKKKWMTGGIAVFIDMMMSLPSIRMEFDTEAKERFLMHLCVMHYYIICCNVFQNNIFGSIVLMMNHFSHSCAPNLIKYTHNDKFVCITVRPIKKGEQLFYRYQENLWNQPRHVCQARLQEQFGFLCDCERCSNESWPVSLDSIKTDRDFQDLSKEMEVEPIEYADFPKCLALKQKCLKILHRHREASWCVELDAVVHWFDNLLNE